MLSEVDEERCLSLASKTACLLHIVSAAKSSERLGWSGLRETVARGSC